jgi:predicted nucleic acid-binding protein
MRYPKCSSGAIAVIAAHALSENLILVSNNTGEFGRIPGLVLQNWSP